MPWCDPLTGRPLPRPSSAQRRSKRRAQIRPIRTEASIRAELGRLAELDSLRMLHEYVTTDPAEIVAAAARVFGPARAAERACVDAELRTTMDAINLHRAVLPGQPVPDRLVTRFAVAWRATRALDREERQDRVIITNGRSAKLARRREAQRRRAAAIEREAAISGAAGRVRLAADHPGDVWAGRRTGAAVLMTGEPCNWCGCVVAPVEPVDVPLMNGSPTFSYTSFTVHGARSRCPACEDLPHETAVFRRLTGSDALDLLACQLLGVRWLVHVVPWPAVPAVTPRGRNAV